MARMKPIPGQAWVGAAPSTQWPCAGARTWPGLRMRSIMYVIFVLQNVNAFES